jgi:hypothetical protein
MLIVDTARFTRNLSALRVVATVPLRRKGGFTKPPLSHPRMRRPIQEITPGLGPPSRGVAVSNTGTSANDVFWKRETTGATIGVGLRYARSDREWTRHLTDEHAIELWRDVQLRFKRRLGNAGGSKSSGIALATTCPCCPDWSTVSNGSSTEVRSAVGENQRRSICDRR